MKLHTKSVVELHALYHRREDGRFVVGDPETGEYLFLSPSEVRALELINSAITLGQVKGLIKEEGEKVDVETLLRKLASKKMIHRIDGKTIAEPSEPKMSFHLPAKQFGNPAVKFLMGLLCLFGIFTLVWQGSIPGPGAFLYQESITAAIIGAALVTWSYIFIRQLAKYGQALYLGLHARFGFKNTYHLYIPTAQIPPATEAQHHKVVTTGMLALLSATSLAAIMAAYTASGFWNFVFLIGILEIIGELLLFLGTDFARYLSYRFEIHKLNEQTTENLKEEWRALFKGDSKKSHHYITEYSFFYLASIVLGIAYAVVYILPITIDVIGQSFMRFDPGNPLYADAIVALSIITASIFIYGFATLRRHPLSHNTLFVNGGIMMIIIASFLAAAVVATWVRYFDIFLSAIILYGLGVALAVAFERAVKLAHPFSDLHSIFETAILPIIAATVPLSILFTVPYAGATMYLMAAMLALGMLSSISLREFSKNIKRAYSSKR